MNRSLRRYSTRMMTASAANMTTLHQNRKFSNEPENTTSVPAPVVTMALPHPR